MTVMPMPAFFSAAAPTVLFQATVGADTTFDPVSITLRHLHWHQLGNSTDQRYQCHIGGILGRSPLR